MHQIVLYSPQYTIFFGPCMKRRMKKELKLKFAVTSHKQTFALKFCLTPFFFCLLEHSLHSMTLRPVFDLITVLSVDFLIQQSEKCLLHRLLRLMIRRKLLGNRNRLSKTVVKGRSNPKKQVITNIDGISHGIARILTTGR